MSVQLFLKHMHQESNSDSINVDKDITESELIILMEKSFAKYDKSTEQYTRYLNTVIISQKNIDVKSQYDEPYNNITNQCSWVAKNILANKNAIIDALDSGLNNELSNVYTKCLENGTLDRITNFKFAHGENIDEINYNVKLYTTSNVDLNNLSIVLGKDIINYIVKPNLRYNEFSIFMNEIVQLKNNKMMIINRDGQSFVIMKRNKFYIVFDSHCRKINFYNIEQLKNHLFENNTDGMFYFIYGIV